MKGCISITRVCVCCIGNHCTRTITSRQSAKLEGVPSLPQGAINKQDHCACVAKRIRRIYHRVAPKDTRSCIMYRILGKQNPTAKQQETEEGKRLHLLKLANPRGLTKLIN
jgi:hypothetical protein